MLENDEKNIHTFHVMPQMPLHMILVMRKGYTENIQVSTSYL